MIGKINPKRNELRENNMNNENDEITIFDDKKVNNCNI